MTYYRRVRPHAGTFVPLMALAFAGSVVGAAVASRIPASAFTPIVLVVLVAVGAYVAAASPALGERTELRFSGHRHTAAAMAAGLVIGAYDGALGPGTGSFFVFTLVGLLGLRVPRGLRQGADGELGDQPRGALRLRPAGRGAVADGAADGCRPTWSGGYLGARTAVARGARLHPGRSSSWSSRAFVVRIGGDVLGLWG